MISLRSVYGIFVLDMSARSAFFAAFNSIYTNVTWNLGENDGIIFGKSVHFVKECSDESS